MTATYTSEPIPIPAEARGGYNRAEIVLEGVEQAGPSFVGHVFLNNPAADRDTERSQAAGYAGAFHVYGQGPAAAAGDEAGGVLAPITKHIIATDAVRAAVCEAGELTVTVVPIARGAGDPAPLDLDRVSIVFS